MENNIKINNSILVGILITSLCNVFIQYLPINSYIKNFTFPIFNLLITYLILLNNQKKIVNVKAYYLLIPIILILISNLLLKIDDSNLFLNVIILPILMTLFFSLLTNKNYKISIQVFSWVNHLIFTNIFSNLSLIKNIKCKNMETKNKTTNIILGILIGCGIGLIILLLLMSADTYFKFFVNKIFCLFKFDLGKTFIFIISFILLFSIYVNILLNQSCKMKKNNNKKIDDIMAITIITIIDIIFVLFLISELSRLTNNFLQVPVQYTYSSYAREGFFQLLVVTTINFNIIMYLLYKTTLIKENHVIKKLILLLICFSIFLIFNSYYRMFLYIFNYGYTVLRLQVILFLAMEMILFLILVKKIVKELKINDTTLYFVIMISFYILNIYLCTNNFVSLLNRIMH